MQIISEKFNKISVLQVVSLSNETVTKAPLKSIFVAPLPDLKYYLLSFRKWFKYYSY